MHCHRVTSMAFTLAAFHALCSSLPALASKDEPETDPGKLSFPIYPANVPHPVKLFAKVAFVSNGFDLPKENCKIMESSGDVQADEQACKSVSYFATPAGKMAIVRTSVWPHPTADADFVKPKMLNGSKFGATIYPDGALRGGQQGTAIFRLLVLPNGKVDTCEIISSSSYSILDERTCKIGLKFQFSPGLLKGEPVSTYFISSIRYYQGAGPRSKPRELP